MRLCAWVVGLGDCSTILTPLTALFYHMEDRRLPEVLLAGVFVLEPRCYEFVSSENVVALREVVRVNRSGCRLFHEDIKLISRSPGCLLPFVTLASAFNLA